MHLIPRLTRTYRVSTSHASFGVVKQSGQTIVCLQRFFFVMSGLKTLDTIGSCQRPVLSLTVSKHMHKTTNLWKFELNQSSKLRINERKNALVIRSCVLSCLISRPQILNQRYRNQICGKLLLSRKLLDFRGSLISQCFILSASPHYSLPRKVLCW